MFGGNNSLARELATDASFKEKSVTFISIFCNRTKPLPVALSIAKEYTEQVPMTLGEKDLRVGGEKWGKEIVAIGESVQLHGEADEVDHLKIKEKILDTKEVSVYCAFCQLLYISQLLQLRYV